MTEEEAREALKARRIFRMAPGLWCDKSVPDLIEVHEDQDTAICVRAALMNARQLPSR